MTRRESVRSDRGKGFLTLNTGLSLCCALMVVLVVADHLCRSRADNRIDAHGLSMTDFLEQLQKRGVRLHVVPAAQHGVLSEGVYLTEDSDATWASMQCRMKAVEHIHHWRGTVWVGRAYSWFDTEAALARWGECGCRIGDFLLFGDERLLRRIQEACR